MIKEGVEDFVSLSEISHSFAPGHSTSHTLSLSLSLSLSFYF
jgi:hypothetical protein